MKCFYCSYEFSTLGAAPLKCPDCGRFLVKTRPETEKIDESEIQIKPITRRRQKSARLPFVW